MKTIDKVINLISKIADIPKENISSKSRLTIDLGLESLDIVTLISTMEEEYNITIPDKDIKTIQTVEDIAKYIDNHD